MLYRMKRNAVGLANICVLSTMVLVIISTTVCLYAGVEDSLKQNFPKEISATQYFDHVPARADREYLVEQVAAAAKSRTENDRCVIIYGHCDGDSHGRKCDRAL